MASGCRKERAQEVVKIYINTIEKYRDSIIKDFNDMDLQNAKIRDSYEEIIKEITKECNNLIDYIQGVRFN